MPGLSPLTGVNDHMMERVMKSIHPIHQCVPASWPSQDAVRAGGPNFSDRMGMVVRRELGSTEAGVVRCDARAGGPHCGLVAVEHAVHHVHLAARRKSARPAQHGPGIGE